MVGASNAFGPSIQIKAVQTTCVLLRSLSRAEHAVPARFGGRDPVPTASTVKFARGAYVVIFVFYWNAPGRWRRARGVF